MSSYVPHSLSNKITQQNATQAASTVLSYAGSIFNAVTTKSTEYVQQQQQLVVNKISGTSNNDAAIERDLDRLYNSRVRPLLDAVDQLRLLLHNTEIKLPTIVVVGDQSSGKSSVLEALSGINLPRGSNITTRVPLVLRLVNTLSDDTTLNTVQSPHATISASGHKEEILNDLNMIGSRIVQLTNSLAGAGVSVVNSPISLTVYRAYSPDLTLVDLPGITRNPVGNQPKTIYHDIINMIKYYIEPEESIILNVMPCSIDFATAECVMLSKQYDPAGKRTIAVVTKSDLAEVGIKHKLQDAIDQLGLSLGLVAVKNRNQVDNDSGITWQQARDDENTFFEKHNELSMFVMNNKQSYNKHKKDTLQSHSSGSRILVGTTALAALLTTIQEHHVRLILPRKRIELRDLLASTRAQLKQLPPNVSTSTDARIRFDSMLTQYCSKIQALCQGDHSIINQLNLSPNQSTEHLHINPRVSEHYAQYQKTLSSLTSQHLTTQFAERVEREIRENTGVTLPNFLSHQVFKGLVSHHLAQLRTPTLTLLTLVRECHASMISTLTRAVFGNFPALAQTLSGQLNEYLEQQYNTAFMRTDEYLSMEDDTFTVNSYYTDTLNKIKDAINNKTYQKMQHNDKQSSQSTPSSRSMLGGWLDGTNTAMSNLSFSDKHVMININDLNIVFDPNNYTLQSTTHNHSASVSGGSVLEMQIATLAYTAVVHKRLADYVALLLRYHFTRAMSQSSSISSNNSLLSCLQAQWTRITDSEIMEYFKEASDVRDKRDALQAQVNKLEKASKVFENI